MRLNSKIIKTLEFDKIKHQLMKHASTESGKAEILSLLPSPNIENVRILQDETEDGCKVVRLKGGLPIPRLKDIRMHLKRLQIGGSLNGKETAEIGRVLRTTKEIVDFFRWFEENEVEFNRLTEIVEQLIDLPDVRKRIISSVSEDGELLNEASVELNRIRNAIRTNESSIRSKLDEIIRGKKAQYLSDAIVTIRNDRFVIPVRQEHKNSFGGVVHDQSATGQTLYIEPQVVLDLNNKLRSLHAQEKQEEERILYEISAELEPYIHELQLNNGVLTHLDVIHAKARYADSMKAKRPHLNGDNHIAIWNARHPLIDPEDVVPNDLILGEEYQAIIITGPNTGGKTIALKTLGIIQLMGQAGLQIPATENSQIGIFNEIFADIGDEQSIEQNLSTFSSHMTNIVSIIDQIDEKSLVLFDELGSGTDPQEGSSLAVSILDYVGSKNSYVMATTHYPELKLYAYNRPATINASMEFDSVSLAPTYRLQIGVPGRSNAFDISRRLGLPEQIIEQASGFIEEDSQVLNEMIADLEQKRRKVDQESLRLKQELSESEDLLKELKVNKEKFEESKEKFLEEARNEANKMVDTTREEAEFLMQEIREMQLNLKNNTTVKEHELIDLRKQFGNLRKEEPLEKNKVLQKEKEKKRLQAGDEVLAQAFGQRGVLLDESSPGEWVVQLGIMKMKIKESQLTKLKEEPVQQKGRSKRKIASVKMASDSHASTQLDLRGQRYENALAALDKYLDEALLASYPQVTIVHGKGTGALREGVTDALKRHPQVKSFHFSPPNAGGNGATVVIFKG